MAPRDVDHLLLIRQPGSLVEHVGVGVDTDDLLEVGGEQECQRTRSTTDVQQSAGAVQLKCGDQNLYDFSGVGDAADRVVNRAPGVQRRIPGPFRLLIRVDLFSGTTTSWPRVETTSPGLAVGACREPQSGVKPPVKVAEQRDLSSVMMLVTGWGCGGSKS